MALRAVTKRMTTRLVEAALSQPNPTEELKDALQEALTLMQHPLRDESRDDPVNDAEMLSAGEP